MDQNPGSVIIFKPCCGERRTSPYVVTQNDTNFGFEICSTTVPTSNSTSGTIVLKGDCPSCETTCNTYKVGSKAERVITFTPCCGERKTSPYVVTEVDERDGFSICSTTVPTSNDPSSTIELIGKCPSC